jgi:hypothetical protein
MKNACNALLIGLALATSTGIASAQNMRAYKEGPVTNVSYIRTKPGLFDDYMKYLGGSYKTQMEANQKAGLIVGYKVFSVAPRNAQDPNVILTITYPNMAALDRTEEFDAVSAKIAGTVEAQNKAYADRGSLRDVLGSQLMREMVLK